MRRLVFPRRPRLALPTDAALKTAVHLHLKQILRFCIFAGCKYSPHPAARFEERDAKKSLPPLRLQDEGW
jgi:hypothetical protein